MKQKLMAVTLGLLTALIAAGPDERPKPSVDKPSVDKPSPTVRLNNHFGKATVLGGERDHWSILAFFPIAGTSG